MKKRPIVIEEFQIRPHFSIKNALKRIGETGERILFVVDEQNKLLGSLTDGDIRRWILKKGSLGSSVEKIFNKTPVCLDKSYNISDVRKMMLEIKISQIPIIDKDRRVIDILFWEDVFSDEFHKILSQLNIPVVIMAGGKGSRLDPLTKILPKALVPFDERPVAEVIMDKFAEYGCKDFYFIVNYKGGMIKSYFDNSDSRYKIDYVWEKRLLGTAGGLRLLPKMKSDSFFVSNCDIVISSDYSEIYEFHKKGNFSMTLVCCMRNFVIPYGIVELGSKGTLSKIVEKPEYHFMVNAGMYVLERAVLDLIPQNKAFDINNLIDKIKNKGGRIGVFPINEVAWIDVGQWKKYYEALNR